MEIRHPVLRAASLTLILATSGCEVFISVRPLTCEAPLLSEAPSERIVEIARHEPREPREPSERGGGGGGGQVGTPPPT